MKIIFDSEEEKVDFIKNLTDSGMCPRSIIMIDDAYIRRIGACMSTPCLDCWKEATDSISEIKEEYNE